MKTQTVYKVEVTSISTGCRIEGISYKISLFTTEQTAMEYAYDLAKKYIEDNEEKPDGNDAEELSISNKYIWSSSDYDDCYPKYKITVKETIMYLDQPLITSSYFSI